jgi:hypothetical protein
MVNLAQEFHRDLTVAEPPELFRLKCTSHRYTANTNSTHFKRNNPLVCRVSARCNHGSTGSKQVYLARERVYKHTTAQQLLIHNILNIITNHFKLTVNLYNIVWNDKLNSLSSFIAAENSHATIHVVKVDTMFSLKLGVIPEGHCQPGTDPTPWFSQTEQRLAM